MIVRNEQLAGMTAAWEQSRRAAFIARLCSELPAQLSAKSRAELEKEVEDGCKAAEALAINHNDHIYRFLRLRYLPASTWERRGAQEMMVRVLTDTSVEAGRRLQFVERISA
jgi:hypothetical protein